MERSDGTDAPPGTFQHFINYFFEQPEIVAMLKSSASKYHETQEEFFGAVHLLHDFSVCLPRTVKEALLEQELEGLEALATVTRNFNASSCTDIAVELIRELGDDEIKAQLTFLGDTNDTTSPPPPPLYSMLSCFPGQETVQDPDRPTEFASVQTQTTRSTGVTTTTAATQTNYSPYNHRVVYEPYPGNKTHCPVCYRPSLTADYFDVRGTKCGRCERPYFLTELRELAKRARIYVKAKDTCGSVLFYSPHSTFTGLCPTNPAITGVGAWAGAGTGAGAGGGEGAGSTPTLGEEEANPSESSLDSLDQPAAKNPRTCTDE